MLAEGVHGQDTCAGQSTDSLQSDQEVLHTAKDTLVVTVEQTAQARKRRDTHDAQVLEKRQRPRRPGERQPALQGRIIGLRVDRSHGRRQAVAVAVAVAVGLSGSKQLGSRRDERSGRHISDRVFILLSDRPFW